MEKALNRTSLILKSIFILMLTFGLLACELDSPKGIGKPVSKIEIPPPSIQLSQTVHPVTEETRETYQWYCAQCHGMKGKGNGINSKYVTVPPRNHTKADYLETRSDQELFDAIFLGGLQIGRAPCMPAWGYTFDEATIWSLVQYIRELCQCEAM